jgi:hypothetical protein
MQNQKLIKKLTVFVVLLLVISYCSNNDAPTVIEPRILTDGTVTAPSLSNLVITPQRA